MPTDFGLPKVGQAATKLCKIAFELGSQSDIASVAHLVIGSQLADVPLILAGIDPCFSCNDRMVVVQGVEPK